MYIYSRAGQILCIFTVELGNSRQLSLQRDNMLMANNGGYSCLVTLYVMAILFLLSGLINFSFRVVFISMLNNCRGAQLWTKIAVVYDCIRQDWCNIIMQDECVKVSQQS